MYRRRLAFVTGLMLGDYLLWGWSSGGDHGALALASGLTLPPLAVAWLWMCACAIGRLLARAGERHEGRRADAGRAVAGGRARVRRARARAGAATGVALEERPGAEARSGRSPRKLAA